MGLRETTGSGFPPALELPEKTNIPFIHTKPIRQSLLRYSDTIIAIIMRLKE